MKLSRREDKRGEVVGLMVERAVRIHGRPLPIQSTVMPNFTTWRFGDVEKSKERSKASRS